MSDPQDKPHVDLGLFKVAFKHGDPCRPMYKDLYHYHSQADKGAQMEPAFQIAKNVKKVSVTFALEGSAVELVPEGNQPLCREMGKKDPDPALEAEYAGNNHCRLTWTLKPDQIRVFRIYCRSKKGDFPDAHKVHAGIFVVFSTFNTDKMRKKIPPPDHTHEDHHKIHLLGADQHHRPIYDIHQSIHHKVDQDAEIEPAYRLRRWQTVLSFWMNMKIKKAQWTEKVVFPQTGKKPDELTCKLTAKDSFWFEWTVKNPKHSPAEVSTFHLVPKLADDLPEALPPDLAEWGSWENYAAALQDIGIDPTVIQPPTCDPVYGVCDPPPNPEGCES